MYDFLNVLLAFTDFDGSRRIFIEFHRFRWILIDFHGFGVMLCFLVALLHRPFMVSPWLKLSFDQRPLPATPAWHVLVMARALLRVAAAAICGFAAGSELTWSAEEVSSFLRAEPLSSRLRQASDRLNVR